MIQHRAQTFLLDCLRYCCFSSAACDIDHGTTGTWRCMHISGIILPSYQTCWKSYRTQKLWKTLTVRSSGGSVHAFICTTQDSLGSVIGVGDFGEGMLTILDLVPSLAPAVDSLRCDAPACAGGSRCLAYRLSLPCDAPIIRSQAGTPLRWCVVLPLPLSPIAAGRSKYASQYKSAYAHGLSSFLAQNRQDWRDVCKALSPSSDATAVPYVRDGYRS
jgi:hypothetical protein